jgi:outer membrane protein assembly factor BamB
LQKPLIMIKSRFLTVFVCILTASCSLCAVEARAETPQQQARDILDAAGIKGGLIVHIGCADGELTAALGENEGYLVHGLDADLANVETARRHIAGLGLYGRISADHWAKSSLPYIDNSVNLVVSENLGGVPTDEVMRVLCPNGAAYINIMGAWTKIVKPRPLQIDEWTHYLHDAAGNAVANDTIVGPPRRSQWVGSPKWSRHHDHMASTSACVSANGRIFYIIDEGSRASVQLPSRWALIARDAFNGTVLWERSIPAWMTQLWPFKSGPAQLPRRLVASGERVYVTLGLDNAPVSALDAATGETVRTYFDTQMTEELIFSQGVLFLMVKKTPPATRWNEYLPKHRAVGQAKTYVADGWPWDEANRYITAIEADTGVVLWQREYPVAPMTLAADANGVFFHDAEKIVCLNRHTGEQLWASLPVAKRSPMPPNFGPTLVVYGDVVLFEGGDPDRVLTALSAGTGQTLWTSNHAPTGHNCPYDLLVVDDLAWVGAVAGGSHSGIFTGWDIHSGEVKKQFPPDVDTYWFHHRCYRSKATVNYLLPARTGTEFVDFRTSHWTIHHWVRGGCLYGVMPCNGLLYTPPHDCACYFESKQYGFGALAPAYTDRPYPQTTPDADRLLQGPAYGAPLSEPPGDDDWPTYRRETTRSGYTRSIVPADLKPYWQTQLEGKLSSLVIAYGKVYVASVNNHTIYALDEATGAVLWTYTAGGRVDSPPTIYKGRAIFGCADGYVYCLRASDGELVWRFQAAPQDLRMTAFEQVESVWPAQGSVLILNDMVYCVAGRSMFLDGGLRFIRLDPVSGAKISEKILDDRDPNSGENLQIHVKRLNMPVALPDILSSDGEYVYMRSQRFDLEGNRQQIPPYSGDHAEQGSQQYGVGMHLFSPTGFLDDSYMHRTYWVFGRSWASGAGGYYQAGKFAPAGRMMAFDNSRIYGFGRLPVYYKWSTPLEYEIFCMEKFPASQSIEYRWSKQSPPILVQAMALADKTLFIAGAPDVVDEEEAFDYWSADPNDPDTDANMPAKLQEQDAALENQRGGLLLAVYTADGNSLAQYSLESLPVWDGMAAANGRLYMSMQNGKVRCFTGGNYPPVVDAGPDQNIYPKAKALLDAAITDDGLPRSDPCDPNSAPIGVTARWTKLDGPGEVAFADPCAAATTATFSEWGKYTLRITTFDGGAPYYDDINVSVFRPGDLDRDGDVDIFDLEILVSEWLNAECDPSNEWCSGADQTAGGSVTLPDYTITAAHWLAGVYPAAPQGLAAAPGANVISLSWAGNAEADLAGYNVYRSLSPGAGYTRINESLLTAPQYSDTNVTNCLNYFYTVTAQDNYGFESAFSNEILANAGPQAVMKLVGGIGVKTVGAYVSNWQDQANSNDATQAVTENRPIWAWSAINGRPAVDFFGADNHLDVADSADINTGGPYFAKTLIIVFKTSSDTTSRQVIWEQGGGSRGLNFYLDSGSLYINGWNTPQGEPQWGPTGLSAPVSAHTAYVATLVLNAGAGTFEGCVNGASIGSVQGVNQLYGHSDDCALGHVEGATKFHDGATKGPADFAGQVAEFYQYNRVLPTADRQTLETALMSQY